MQQKIPNKLVFSPGSPERKKRSYLLIGVLVVLQLCLIWPVYPLFSSPRPLILGLPLSFIWIISILIIAFTVMLVYFRLDKDEEV